jgi:hypothetical protein
MTFFPWARVGIALVFIVGIGLWLAAVWLLLQPNRRSNLLMGLSRFPALALFFHQVVNASAKMT